MNEALQELARKLDALIRMAREIRVERWLSEWPQGHPERPTAPKFVRDFLKGD